MSKKTTEISEEDILGVVKDLNYEQPTKEQIDYVLEGFESKADDDPTGYWAVWIEQLLDEAGVKQIPKPKL